MKTKYLSPLLTRQSGGLVPPFPPVFRRDKDEKNIEQKLWWKGISTIRSHVKECITCKNFKKLHQKYEKLTVKEVIEEVIPWDTVQIDTIGIYSQLFAKTMINPATE